MTEVKNYLKGLYGKPPGEVDPDLLKKVLKDEEPFQGRPADLLAPQMEKARKELGDYMEKEEDILSYILFPQQALALFKARRKGAVSAQELHLEKIYTVDETLLACEDGKYFIYPCA